jgi:hypothetical protein
MNCRPFKEADLPEVIRWFVDIEWPLPAVENLFPNLGFIVEEEGKLLSCGWLYTTQTSLAFLSWTATNPDLDAVKRSEALDVLITSVQTAVQKNSDKIKVVMCVTRSEAFVGKLKKLGFRSKKGQELATWIPEAQ